MPGGRSRAVSDPSPEPLGRLPGVVSVQDLAVTPGSSLLVFTSKSITILNDFGSFWGRSWVPLGGHFRSSWRFFPLKWLPEPSSKRLIFEKVNFHEISRFLTLLGPPGSHMAPPKRPRSLQDGSLILLDRFCSLLDFRFDFGSFLAPF